MGFDILQMLIVLVILFLLVRPVGTYMAAVFTRKPTRLDRVFDPIDSGIYRLSGVNPDENQRWPAYVKAMLITNLERQPRHGTHSWMLCVDRLDAGAGRLNGSQERGADDR